MESFVAYIFWIGFDIDEVWTSSRRRVNVLIPWAGSCKGFNDLLEKYDP